MLNYFILFVLLLQMYIEINTYKSIGLATKSFRFFVWFSKQVHYYKEKILINYVLTILLDDLLPSFSQLDNSAFVESLDLRGKRTIYTVDEASLPSLTPIIFASDQRWMWSGVIMKEDDVFTSCQFWPLFLDLFAQFH